MIICKVVSVWVELFIFGIPAHCVFSCYPTEAHTQTFIYTNTKHKRLYTHKTHTQSNAYTQTHTPTPSTSAGNNWKGLLLLIIAETNIFMCGICRAEFLWICITNRLDKTDKKKHQHLLCNCRFPLDMQSQQIAERKHWIKRQTSTEYAIAKFLWICIMHSKQIGEAGLCMAPIKRQTSWKDAIARNFSSSFCALADRQTLLGLRWFSSLSNTMKYSRCLYC